MSGCKKCGAPLPLSKGRHRPRLFCTTCSPSRAKSPLNGPVEDPVMLHPEATPDLVSATVRKLRAAGKDYEPEGLVVIELAKSIAAGAHSGSSLAALSREYTRALAAACASADQAEEDDVTWDVG